MYDISQLVRSSRGLTRLSVAYVVIALGAGTSQFGVQAEEETARYRPQRAIAQPADTDQRQIMARVDQDRADKARLYVFRSPKGHEIMTNTPSKFRNRPGYIELDPSSRRPTRPVQNTYQYSNNTKTVSVSSVRGIPEDIKRHVSYHARLNGLDESLVYAVIMAESGFDRNAKSSKGAQGLMQLMPATAAQFGIRNPFDAGESIRGGTRYLRVLLDRFNNDLQLALAGYNAGPEKVKEFGGIPPYNETRDFIRRVISKSSEFNDSGVTTAAVFASDTKSSGSSKLPLVSDRRPKDFLVHFTSGHVQQANNVVDDGDYYIIQYRGRSFRVEKTRIRSVTQGV